MKNIYFEDAERKYGATRMMSFRVAIIHFETEEIIETIEVVESNCSLDLFNKMKQDKRVKEALKKNCEGILAVINEDK